MVAHGLSMTLLLNAAWTIFGPSGIPTCFLPCSVFNIELSLSGLTVPPSLKVALEPNEPCTSLHNRSLSVSVRARGSRSLHPADPICLYSGYVHSLWWTIVFGSPSGAAL